MNQVSRKKAVNAKSFVAQNEWPRAEKVNELQCPAFFLPV
jgi:hypothetical protein